MNKARRKISEAMPEIDLVIEVLDARLPFSSTNPMVDELRRGKLCIKVLNKADLADPKQTQAWVKHFEQQQDTKALPMVAEDRNQTNKLITLIKQFGATRSSKNLSTRVMIMGIPNVGKSTLINALSGRNIAKTGNEPAVTKSNQMIDLKNGIVLSDTPGILWPKFENMASGYRLAASGAVKDTAIEYTDVAHYALAYLLEYYPQELSDRFKFKTLPTTAEEALKAIAQRRGCLKPGGILDTHKAAELCLHELRAGKIGLITLETPALVMKELAIIKEQEEARLAAELEAAKAEKDRTNSSRFEE